MQTPEVGEHLQLLLPVHNGWVLARGRKWRQTVPEPMRRFIGALFSLLVLGNFVFCMFTMCSQAVLKVFLKIFPIAPHFLSQYCLAVVQQHPCM
jgi:hypothetical protein